MSPSRNTCKKTQRVPMKYYFSRGWLVTLLILSVLLSGCSSFGPSSSLHNRPSSEATPTPSPEPTERPVFKMSVDEDVINPIDVYPEAVAAMRRCEFEHAAELFQQLGSFSDSAENYAYCLERLAAEEIPENKRYTGIRNRIEDFDGGYLYAISVGYLYVPHVCDENTRCCIYFAGGAGQDYLYREGVYRYLMKYQPNGIILFHYESCVTHWPGGIRNAAKIMRQVEQECNIVLHDMITVGSSSGSFTALHAAALLQEEFNIPVHPTRSASCSPKKARCCAASSRPRPLTTRRSTVWRTLATRYLSSSARATATILFPSMPMTMDCSPGASRRSSLTPANIPLFPSNGAAERRRLRDRKEPFSPWKNLKA